MWPWNPICDSINWVILPWLFNEWHIIGKRKAVLHLFVSLIYKWNCLTSTTEHIRQNYVNYWWQVAIQWSRHFVIINNCLLRSTVTFCYNLKADELVITCNSSLDICTGCLIKSMCWVLWLRAMCEQWASWLKTLAPSNIRL